MDYFFHSGIKNELKEGGQVLNEERVHDKGFFVCRDLNQAEPWPVGLFADEFRVDRKRAELHQLAGELAQFLRIFYEHSVDSNQGGKKTKIGAPGPFGEENGAVPL